MANALDPRALEEKTQAIGRRLFSAAKHHHQHLSVLNRTTAEVLSWCLGDAAIKSSVLRLIDVLPVLNTPREIARHVLDYFPSGNLKLPPALRLGSQMARSGLMTHTALALLVRRLTEAVARQFIAESHAEAAQALVKTLASKKLTCSFDILGEQVLSEPEANGYAALCGSLLDHCAAAYTHLGEASMPPSCGPHINLSVKPSALTPRYDPISPKDSLSRACARLLPLMEKAAARDGLINLDMEQVELRDLTLQLAQQLLLHPDREAHAHLGIVVQAYLKDSEQTVEALLEWLRRHERALTIRLVKGAYWDYEQAYAAQMSWPSPVYLQKPETDAAFESLTQKLLLAHPLVTTAIASHNIRSIAHAMAVAEMTGMAKDQLEFQLLYGMGDAIAAALSAEGFAVRIYTPIGEPITGMAYLVRRILENTANESFLRQEFTDERKIEGLLKAPYVSPSAAVSVAKKPDYAEALANVAENATRENLIGALHALDKKLPLSASVSIAGDKRQGGKVLTVVNPAHPAQVLGSVSLARPTDVDEAAACAVKAQPVWARTPVSERVAALRRSAALVRERRAALTALAVLEVGKTWREADVEIVETIEYLEYYAGQMEVLAFGKPMNSALGERNRYQYVPRGVAVVIAPWNFPAAIFTGMAAAALVAGNAVLLKPAEQSSLIAAEISRIFLEAGIPPDVVSFLPGLGEEIGSALVEHPGTRMVLFTGSKAVGLSIVEACGKVSSGQRFVKHAITEMGGKNPIIVDADADLDAAVSGILRSGFSYAGQKCSAASRLIVHEAVYDRLLPRLIAAVDRLVVGDPSEPTTDLGPLIEASAQQRLHEARDYARRTAKIAYEYPVSRLPKEGYYVGPMLVTDIDSQNRLALEELFGPLLCLFRVKNFEEALALANATDYALTGGLFSRSPSHIAQAMRDYDVGNLYINRPITGAMVGRQPFGGHRLSGLGTKSGGPDYLLQLMIPKTISLNTTRYGMPLE